MSLLNGSNHLLPKFNVACITQETQEICHTCSTCKRLQVILRVQRFFFLFPFSLHMSMNSSYTAVRRIYLQFKMLFLFTDVFTFVACFDLFLFSLLLNKGYCLLLCFVSLPPTHRVSMHLSIKCNYIIKKTLTEKNSSTLS